LLKRKESIHIFKEGDECEGQETAVYELRAVPVSKPVAYRLFVSQVA
jgi:hypothetical protein